MEIRDMRYSDLEQIVQLEKVCFSDPWSLPMLEPELTNPLSLWLVVVEGSLVLGYIGSQTVLDASDIMNVAVHPQYRRQGVAQKLVEALSSRLSEKKVRFLSLEVRASNEPAIALYERNGFSTVGVRPGYYRHPKEDARIMRKELI